MKERDRGRYKERCKESEMKREKEIVRKKEEDTFPLNITSGERKR